MPEKNARPNSYRALASPFVRSGADFDQYLAVRLVLLSRQLKDSGSHQQQNREQQLIRFHIGRLVGHPYHSSNSPACSCISIIDDRTCGHICSLEHGTTSTKPPAKTSATPDKSGTTKATQASAATRTESMAEASLKPLKAILQTIREQADFGLKQLQQSEEERSIRWKCKDCRYIKHFTRPVALEAAGRCPRCKSISFQCLP